MPDTAAARSGEAVDGRRLLQRAVGFGRALRAAGLSVDLAAEIDFARSLEIVSLGDREEVRAAGAAVFTRRRDDRAVYDVVFDRYWRARPILPPGLQLDGNRQSAGEATEAGAGEPAKPGEERAGLPEDAEGRLIAAEDGAELDATGDEVDAIAPDAYSRSEVLRHRDFDRMTPAELRDAERLVDLLKPRLELRRTRRYELHPHGRRLATRAMFRRNLGTGGELLNWVWRRHVRRPRRIVVICDISGSMERHSRLLLRFVQALSASSAVPTESFVFGTRLTRVTRILRD
ncbi:MAG TPA: VWA domain-containing protein, partial [Candidatus Eisenbacteria bacterium]|nr:VWA domain-containing protein [Candidatus Eisenbacteria bacterium]